MNIRRVVPVLDFTFITVFMLRDVSAENMNVHTVTLYTELVDIIGKNTSCVNQKLQNETENDSLVSKPGIVVSNYKFRKTDIFKSSVGECDVSNFPSENYSRYDWNCFATNNSTSRDINWLFVDCVQYGIRTIQCIKHREVSTFIDNLCKRKEHPDNKLCQEFSFGEGSYAVCSRNFMLRRTVRDITDPPTRYTSYSDIIAYLCIAFILVTFFLAVLIPAEKCKPTYKYDKEQERRVPLKIYEMYGVSYQPAAKKRHNRRSVNTISVPTIASHMANIAAFANSTVDWKGHKTKFNFNQPLFNPLENGLTKNKTSRAKENENINIFHYGERKRSCDSTGSVGSFDYKLFQNHIEISGGNMTSEKRNSSLGKQTPHKYFTNEEEPTVNDRQIYSCSAYNRNVAEKQETIQKRNDADAKGLGNLAGVSEELSINGVTYFEEKDEMRPDSSLGVNDMPNSNQLRSGYSQNIGHLGNALDTLKDYVIYNGNADSLSKERTENEKAVSELVDSNQTEKRLSCRNQVCKNTVTADCCGYSQEAHVNENSITTEYNAFDKLETISECPGTVRSETEEYYLSQTSCAHCGRVCQSNEDSVVQDNSRPRISITLEFPRNFEVENVTSVVKQVNIKQGNKRFTRRSKSTENTPSSDSFSKMKRKYSIC